MFPEITNFLKGVSHNETRLLSFHEGKRLKEKRHTLNPVDYKYVVYKGYRKGKKARFAFKRLETIDEKKFEPGYYRIYLMHEETQVERLLASGWFKSFPRKSKFSHRTLGARTFIPKPFAEKPQKGWIPTWQMYERMEYDLNTAAILTDSDARSTIFPLRRWYNPEYQIFSDTLINVNKKVKAIAISTIVQFVYPSNKWVQNSTFVITLDHPLALKNLHTRIPQMKDSIEAEANFRHPAADSVTSLEISGFIPLEYIATRKD